MPGVRAQSRRFAQPSAARSSRGIAALRRGWVALMIGGLGCCALSLPAQTSDSTMTDQHQNSWTATTDSTSDHLKPTRITETHMQNGNRTLDKRSVEIRGSDGHFEPYQEIETETLQVDATTVRTTTRTFGRDVNGAKSLIQVTAEEKHTLPGGASHGLRTTFNPDVNGKLQPVQREMVETKIVGKDVEETNTTVILPNINGGLAPALKTYELRTRRADGTIESHKTTLLPDGAGNWQANEVRQATTRQEGTNRTAEERVSRLDSEGKLSEVSDVVSRESESASGEPSRVVETYSIDVPWATRDGSLHLVERTTSTERSSSTGEQATEQKVELTNPGNPALGLRVSILVDGKIVPGPSGGQSTVTIRARDSNGKFGIVSVDTTKADRVPTIQAQQTLAGKP
jgi:hypothetical protein